MYDSPYQSGGSDSDTKSDSEPEDWYNESDTSENIPDPNVADESLFQDVDMLPEILTRDHFVEGVLYATTMRTNRKQTSLGMVIEKKDSSFIFRAFFVRGSKRKTFHEGAKDAEIRYENVWRLAPRRELVVRRKPEDARIGQTLRFEYTQGPVTIRVVRTTSTEITGILECGRSRGQEKVFEKIEMQNCTEIFGSSILQQLYQKADSSEWADVTKTKTKDIPTRKPALKFMCPRKEKHKRKYHVLKLLGEGSKLLCECTNKRAKRILARSRSAKYRKQWKDLTDGPRF